MAASFLDSNVLLYFAARDAAKADRAEALLRAGGTITVQVLNEMAVVMRRKFGYGWRDVDAVLALVRQALDVLPITTLVHERGLAVARRYKLAVHDSMLIGAALLADCDTLWSEDMHDGLVIEDRLTIRNPFAS